MERYARTKIGQLAIWNRKDYIRTIVRAQEHHTMDDVSLCNLSIRLTKMDKIRAIALGKQDEIFLFEEQKQVNEEDVSSIACVSFSIPRRLTSGQRAARVA